MYHAPTNPPSELQVHKSAQRKSPRKAGEIDTLILEDIVRSNRPVKAYDIVRKSALGGDTLLPVQVYRSLDRLRASGKIERVATLNAFVSSQVNQPIHFLCTNCGSVGTAEAADAYGLLSELCRKLGFLAQEPHLEVSGRCGHCENSRAK